MKSLKEKYIKIAMQNHLESSILKKAAFQRGPLYRRLNSLRTLLAKAAQKVYNSWRPEDEFDDFGGGGICDEVSNEMSDVIYSYLKIEADIQEGGHQGDDHAWLIVSKGNEAYGVDIPSRVYETGGGYSWQKIPGIRISPRHVNIWWIGPRDLREY